MANLDSILKSRDITLSTKIRLVKAMILLWSCMDVRVGLWRRLSAEELMLLTVVLEKTLESPLDCKEIQPVHSEEDQPWVFFGRNDAKAETPVLWPPHVKTWFTGKDWCREALGAGGEGDNRGWDDWMASPTQWTWVWVNSRRWWWWAGRLVMLQSMGSQRVRHNWATEGWDYHADLYCFGGKTTLTGQRATQLCCKYIYIITRVARPVSCDVSIHTQQEELLSR